MNWSRNKYTPNNSQGTLDSPNPGDGMSYSNITHTWGEWFNDGPFGGNNYKITIKYS